MMITFLNWKMKAKFNQIFLRGLFPLTPSLMGPCYLPFQSLVFRRLWSFLTKTSASTVMSMALLALILYWVTNTQYLMRHWSFSFPFLFSASLTFLSGAWKNMRSYCCRGETKFNFWVGNRRIIHEQISSKWYDLLNFGLWFIFMYSCYC